MNLASILQEVQQYNLFVDLDGVITDFDSRYAHYTGVSPEEMDAQLTTQYGKKKAQSMFWSKVDGVGAKFWEDMEYMPDAQQLINFLKPYEYKFLSSPSRSATSREGKTNWAKREFPNIELILRIANQKQEQEFAGPKNILIDDRPSNIEQWKAKGGIGILHKSAFDTIKQLEKLGFKKGSIDEIQIKSIKPIIFKYFYRANGNAGKAYIKGGDGNYDAGSAHWDDDGIKLYFELGGEGEEEKELIDLKNRLDKKGIKYKYEAFPREYYGRVTIPKNYVEVEETNIYNEIQVSPSKPVTFKITNDHSSNIKTGLVSVRGSNMEEMSMLKNNILLIDFEINHSGDDDEQVESDNLDDFTDALDQAKVKYTTKRSGGRRISYYQIQIPPQYVSIVKPNVNEIQIKASKPISFKRHQDENYGSFTLKGNNEWWGGELENDALYVEFDIDAGDREDREDYENEASLFGSLLKQKGIKYKYQKDRDYRMYTIPMTYVDIVKELSEIQVQRPVPVECISVATKWFEKRIQDYKEMKYGNFEVIAASGEDEDRDEVTIQISGNKPADDYSEQEKAHLLTLMKEIDKKLPIHTFSDIDLDELEFMSWNSDDNYPNLFWIHPTKENYNQEITTLFQILNKYKGQSINEIQISKERLIVGKYYGFEWAGYKPWKLVQISPNKDLRKYIYKFEDESQPHQRFQTITKQDLDTIVFPRKLIKQINKIDEIQIAQPLNFNDKNLYIGTYKGGSKDIDELMRVDQLVHIYNLGPYVTFRPSGALENKVFLMPKKYFALEKEPWGHMIDPENDLQWIQKAIKGNIYQKIK